MRVINGDLLELADNGNFDVIVHGCNCFCEMGAGIALQIKSRFPEAYAIDCKTEKGSREKLGSYSKADVHGSKHGFMIVNAYTQFDWHGNGVLVDYDALRNVMKKIKRDFSGLRIAYPMIGAGLAGGDWKLIAKIIDEELVGENHTLVRFDRK